MLLKITLLERSRKDQASIEEKLPFKFLGHYAAKCPYKKKEDNNVEGVKHKGKSFYKPR